MGIVQINVLKVLVSAEIWIKCVKVGPNWIKLVHIGSKVPTINTNLVNQTKKCLGKFKLAYFVSNCLNGFSQNGIKTVQINII